MYFSAFFETLEASLFIYQSGSRQNNPNKKKIYVELNSHTYCFSVLAIYQVSWKT